MGQFMTPASVARFMASLFADASELEIRLLDPGAAVGSLTAAFIDNLCSRIRPRRIKVAAYEVEPILADRLTTTLDECRAAGTSFGIEFSGEIVKEDFIHAGCAILRGELPSGHRQLRSFTHVIVNPPYKKIRGDSEYRKDLRSVGIETANLYTAFLAISIKLLSDHGELVAIVPRSFCNGPYFRPFRKLLLENMTLQHIHVFHSRKQAFKDDDVLQENIIFHAVKGAIPDRVDITASNGPNFDDMTVREADYCQVVKANDPEHYIHVAPIESDQVVMNRMARFNNSLQDLGIGVSTGPVVDFRLKDFLVSRPVKGTSPLIYTAHFDGNIVRWPKENCRKPNAIQLAGPVLKWLMPNGCYVVTKRFSAKEERRRIVAAIYDEKSVPGKYVAFENHLNVFHLRGKGLPLILAKGLTVYLNSSLVDQYFRIFSGHTQVNATDLRKIPYPSVADLEALGRAIGTQFPEQEGVDQIFEEILF
jgi:adenine-specific DNA-methyltransferase